MSINISHPWARVQAPSARFAGGYMTLVNTGAEPDSLLEASCPLAQRVEVCGIKVVGPGIRMRPLEGGIRLPPGVAITLRPRGYHLLFRRLKSRFVQGQRVPVTLRFDKAGRRDLELVVEADGVVGLFALFASREGKPGANAAPAQV